jgi:flavin reductase (DIM6/NTAB) family NADH-FMN oxidoreductase RutF
MSAAFDADFRTLPRQDRYKLLTGLVVPRPIALVTAVDEDGTVNAAPFSFFNVFSEDPPIVVLGLQSKADGNLKDTAALIREGGSFVVNLVDEDLAERMNICSVDFPRGVSELTAAGLTTAPSRAVPAPRIAEAPAALECRHFLTLELGRARRLALGEIVWVHARPGIVDPARMYVDLAAYKPVARLFGNLYARLGEKFTLVRQSYAEWQTSLNGGRAPPPPTPSSPPPGSDR